MSLRALVVGGTGPTGPFVVRGLQERGFDVTVLHRGTHELPELADVEHVHADPHFRETLAAGLGARRFTLAVAAYGRLRHVADVVAGSCEQLIAVSGAAVYPGYHEPGHRRPRGVPVGAREEDALGPRVPVGVETAGERFSRLILEAEEHVWALHRAGAFSATVLRYPSIYGPRQLYPREWSVIRRVLDGRERMILPDAGLTISMRCAAENAAGHVLAAVDHREAAAGEVLNVGDRQQFTVRQWVEMTACAAGRELELVTLPFDVAGPGRGLFPVLHTDHCLLDLSRTAEVLGGVEVLPATTALQRTVAWYLDHPPAATTVDRLVDTFNYAEEDRVIDVYRAALAVMAASQTAPAAAVHPYAHPRRPDDPDHRAR